MNVLRKIGTAAIAGAALMTAQTSEAQRRGANQNVAISQPKAIRKPARTDRTYISRKQEIAYAKAEHNRTKAMLATAQRDLVAVTRSEMRNRQLRTDAKNRMEQAEQEYKTNSTTANAIIWQRAQNQYEPTVKQHEAARWALFAQRSRVQQLENFQKQALNAIVQGRAPPPQPGSQPQFANPRPTQFVRPVAVYDRIPSSRNLPAHSQNHYDSPGSRLSF